MDETLAKLPKFVHAFKRQTAIPGTPTIVDSRSESTNRVERGIQWRHPGDQGTDRMRHESATSFNAFDFDVSKGESRCCRVEFVDDHKGSSFLDFGTCTFLHETKLQLRKDKVYGLLGSTMWQDHTHASDPGGSQDNRH